MNRIIKIFGSLMVSAAALTAFAVTSYADAAVSTVHASPAITSLTAEVTEDGNKISWGIIKSESYIFLFREAAGELSLAAMLPPGTVSYVDPDTPGGTCVYSIQTDITVDGTTVMCSSNRVVVSDGSDIPDVNEISSKLDARLTIGNGKATVSWNRMDASGYIVTMDGKTVFETSSNDVYSYTVGIANYSAHTFTVKAYSGSGVIEESAPMVTTSLDTILNSARTSQTRSFSVINRQNTAAPASSKNLSDHDIAVIEKFAAENFTPGMSDAEKIRVTHTWINRNVKYASSSADWNTISSKSYVDAIFTYKRGQCAQYNGALVSMMRYLGYDADLVLGWRGNSRSYWQHYWGEVEIDGLRFVIEAGNYGKYGPWSYLLVPYSRTDGKFII